MNFAPKDKEICPHCGEYLKGFEDEMWQPIENYEGLYWISSHGRIRSSTRNNSYAKIFFPSKNCNGYFLATLTKDGKSKKLLAHRLVAKAFIPNPSEYDCINHIDCNRMNNKVENLEWCTRAMNNAHSKEMGRLGGGGQIGSKHKSAKLNEYEVLKIKQLIAMSKRPVELIKEISNQYNVSETTIRDIRSGRRWKHVSL